MGEAKRKVCICGSSKLARQCCFNGRTWHKPSAVLDLKALPPKSAVAKCYMKELHSCDGPISREHLLSESVIRLLKADGDFSVSGLRWLEAGEAKLLAPGDLTAKCLCRKHNSALAPLDAAGDFLVTALKFCLERNAGSMHYLVSGHDIERWLLKTIKALAVSGNLARGRQPLSGAFANDIQVLRMLDEPTSWPDGAGLYCIMEHGQRTINHTRMQIEPYLNERDEVNGLRVNIVGLDFVLMLGPPNLARARELQRAKFRPSKIEIKFAKSANWIAISWDDGMSHRDTLTLQDDGLLSKSKSPR